MNKQYLKNKIEEKRQQIFPQKEGQMFVGGPKYEERLNINALDWVGEIIDSQNDSVKYVKLNNKDGGYFNDIPLDLIKKVTPIQDKEGNLLLAVEYYDEESCINCSVFCDYIEITEENNPYENDI